ncbi:hypothetical protein GCM10019998_10940 [Tetragenococcus solitarius]|uniref:Uncharacterized protein n=2 Tax=Tetragenococcus solitarius TaxID=71453 RepID=A0ABP6KLG2_9ENTE
MGVTALIGQSFHLLSPLVLFIYILLRLTGVDMGHWQKKSVFCVAGLFLVYVAVNLGFGIVPLTEN